MDERKLVIVGAGGWGIEALWVARAMTAAGSARWDVLGFADDRAGAVGTEFYGVPILCSTSDLASFANGNATVFIAIGDNRTRRKVAERLAAQGLPFATLIHPKAELAGDSVVGEGSYVAPFATLAPQSRIGRHVLINIHAVVGHEVLVGDYSQLAPGVVVTGACSLGEGVFVGSNASLYPGCRLGDNAVISANSFVVTDVGPDQTAMGVPARPMFRRK